MVAEILRNFNWIDILMVCIIVRVVYIGFKNGFIIELFKILTIVFAIFITLHYYSRLGYFLSDKFSFIRVSFDVLSFCLLWLLVIGFFKLIRDGVLLLLKIEAHPLFHKWGGLLLGVFRSVMTCSLLFLLLAVIQSNYIVQISKNSFVRPYLNDLAPDIYRGFYDTLITKFFPGEKLNQKVFKLKGFESKENPD